MSDRPRYVPAYGPVQDVVGYGFFFVTVRAVGPTVVSVLGAHGIDPAVVSYGLAIALWLLLGLTLVGIFQRQLQAIRRSGRRTDGRSTRRRTGPPSTTRLGTYLVVAAITGAFVVGYWAAFVRSLVAIIHGVGTFPVLTFSPTAIAWIVVMGIAMGVFGWCLDRVVVGVVRRQLYVGRPSEAAVRD